MSHFCSVSSIVVLMMYMSFALTSIAYPFVLLAAGVFGFSNGSLKIFNIFNLEIASPKTLFLPLICTNVIL